MCGATKYLKKKKNFMAPFYDGVQLPQGLSHFKETVYFLPLSSQIFLVLILSTSEGWKAESTLEPPTGFEYGTPGLGIQHLNHLRFKKKEETKTPRQIRHVSYCEWALKIMKFHQEDTFTHYSYIRALVPNDIKDEILEDSYKMSLKEFCKAMQINLLKCFTGSCFWKIYCKTFAAFLVNFLVNFF